LFQGIYKHRNYFEGWYFKLISLDHKYIYAVIPGIAYGDTPADSHAFVQVINGTSGQVDYFKFPAAAFKYDKGKFAISVGENRFTRNTMHLELSLGNARIEGDLEFYDIIPFPRSILSPGIMGPYSFVPFMECYHGIINVSHKIKGILEINGTPADFSAGEGYLEKDYGRSFPSDWIWVQANHFNLQRTCFMFSLARIPWFRSSFIGMICFLLHEGQFYRWATYNNSRIESIELDGKNLAVTLKRQDHSLRFHVEAAPGGFLKAPKNGLMNRTIEETISARVELTFTVDGNTVFKGTSPNAGYEISPGATELIRVGS